MGGTKATLIDKATRNNRAVQLLRDHTKIKSTERNGTDLGAKSQIPLSQQKLGSILISVGPIADVKIGSSFRWNDGELGRTVAKSVPFSTERYSGVEIDDALEIAETWDVFVCSGIGASRQLAATFGRSPDREK